MATVVGTVYLNGCNYQLAYDLLSQNVDGNYSTVRLYGILNVTNNYVSWSRGSASVHTSGLQGIGTYYSRGSYTVITQDFNFSHDAAGNFSAYIGASLSTTFTSGDTGGTITLPSIPRQANVTSASDFNDEQNPTIKFNNTGGFRINARLEFGGTNIQRNNIPNTGSYTFNLTDSERDLLRSKCPNSNSLSVREVIATCIGGTSETHWSWQDKKMSIINANPLFSNFEYEDTNNTTKALTGNNQIVVKGHSDIKVKISTANKAEAVKNATMKKYQMSITGNNSVDINYSDTQEVNGTINEAKDGVINVYAIDSRNNTTLVSKVATNTINYTDIEANQVNAKAVRDDGGVGKRCNISFNGTFWNGSFGKNVNEITTITYRFKKTTDTTWVTGTSTIIPTIDGNSYSFNGLIKSNNANPDEWDLEDSYNIEITISDKLSAVVINLVLNSAIPTLALSKNGVGIMGKYDESLGGLLQVGGSIISGGKLLWTNPNPTSSFASQTVTLSSDDYDMLEIFYYDYVGTNNMYSTKLIKGNSGNLMAMFQYNDHGYIGSRKVLYNSDTSYMFTNGVTIVQSDNFNRAGTGEWCVPIYIIGYKTGLFE